MFKQSLLQVISKIIKLFLGFSVSVVISKHFGPELYGSFVFGVAIYSLGSVIVISGLESIVLKEVFSNNRKLPNGILIQFVIAGGVLLLLSLFILPIVLFKHFALEYQIIVLLCISLIFQPLLLLKVGLMKHERWLLINKVEIISVTSSAILKIMVVFMGFPITAIAAVMIFEVCIAAFLYAIEIKKISKRRCNWLYKTIVQGLQSKKIDIDLFKKSIPQVTSSLIAVLLLANDKLMLGILSDGVDLGVYAVAQAIAQAFMILPVALGPLIETRLNISYLDNRIKFKKEVMSAYLGTGIAGILIYFIMLQISESIIIQIYGEVYRDSIEILKVLCFANIFVFLVSLTRRVQTITRSGWDVAKIYLLILIFNTISSYYLIVEYGASGAAQACLYTWMFGVFIFVIRNVVSNEKI